MYALRARGTLPNLVALHPVRTMEALIFIGALVAGVALGVSAMLGRRADPAPVTRRGGSTSDTRISGPRQRGASWPGPVSRSVRGASQPRPAARDLTPARGMEQGWTPDLRRAPPGSGPRQTPSQPARRPAATQRDERGRWPDAPDRW
jgi:hypothetical protein